jgi:hypothetical protein
MNQTRLLSLFVATVTWIPIRIHTSVERGGGGDHKRPSRTGPGELYIPLH